MTGFSAVRVGIVDILQRDQIVLNVAGALVGFVMSFLVFRSVWAALIVAVPSIGAGLLVVGFMGLLGPAGDGAVDGDPGAGDDLRLHRRHAPLLRVATTPRRRDVGRRGRRAGAARGRRRLPARGDHDGNRVPVAGDLTRLDRAELRLDRRDRHGRRRDSGPRRPRPRHPADRPPLADQRRLVAEPADLARGALPEDRHGGGPLRPADLRARRRSVCGARRDAHVGTAPAFDPREPAARQPGQRRPHPDRHRVRRFAAHPGGRAAAWRRAGFGRRPRPHRRGSEGHGSDSGCRHAAVAVEHRRVARRPGRRRHRGPDQDVRGHHQRAGDQALLQRQGRRADHRLHSERADLPDRSARQAGSRPRCMPPAATMFS